MRRGFGLMWFGFTVLVAGTAGWFAYHAGLAAAAGDGPGAAGYAGMGIGFGLFGLVPLLLFLLFLGFVFRMMAFGMAMRHGGWRGGFGHRGAGGHGSGEVPPWVQERLTEWHRRAHEPAGGPVEGTGA